MFKPTTAADVEDYLGQIDEPRRSEIKKIHEFICQALPGHEPFIMHNIICYGKSKFQTKSGSKGEWFIVGLASQKNYISIYACSTVDGKYIAEKYIKELGKADIGKSCIRYANIEDIPWDTLSALLKESIAIAKANGLFAE